VRERLSVGGAAGAGRRRTRAGSGMAGAPAAGHRAIRILPHLPRRGGGIRGIAVVKNVVGEGAVVDERKALKVVLPHPEWVLPRCTDCGAAVPGPGGARSEQDASDAVGVAAGRRRCKTVAVSHNGYHPKSRGTDESSC
jgi:hypothetical protein